METIIMEQVMEIIMETTMVNKALTIKITTNNTLTQETVGFDF